MPAGKSALLAAASILIIYFIRKRTRLGMVKIIAAVEDAGRTMLTIGAVAAGAGIVVGAVHLSGSAFALTMVLRGQVKGSFLFCSYSRLLSLSFWDGDAHNSHLCVGIVLVAPSLIRRYFTFGSSSICLLLCQ
jgi:hypothetical protein